MHVLDMFSVGIIGVSALGFILRYFFKMRQDKCTTLCAGCSANACSTKTFKPQQRVIPLKSIPG